VEQVILQLQTMEMMNGPKELKILCNHYAYSSGFLVRLEKFELCCLKWVGFVASLHRIIVN